MKFSELIPQLVLGCGAHIWPNSRKAYVEGIAKLAGSRRLILIQTSVEELARTSNSQAKLPSDANRGYSRQAPRTSLNHKQSG
jgi:hypothetical protein